MEASKNNSGIPPLIAPPPLTPGALRISILNQVRRYQQLFPARSATEESPSLPIDHPESTHPESEAQLRFRVVQDALVKDLRQLVVVSQSLERKLTSERSMKWITHSTIALATQVLVSKFIGPLLSFLRAPQNAFAYGTLGTMHRRTYQPYLGIFQLLQWFAYPIAVFQISRHEKRINDTSNLCEELLALLKDIEQGRELNKSEVACFSDAAWDSVPWQLLENP